MSQYKLTMQKRRKLDSTSQSSNLWKVTHFFVKSVLHGSDDQQHANQRSYGCAMCYPDESKNHTVPQNLYDITPKPLLFYHYSSPRTNANFGLLTLFLPMSAHLPMLYILLITVLRG